MELLYTLTDSQQKTLGLRDGETIWYCVPADLKFDNERKSAETAYTGQTWLVVTEERFMVLEGAEPVGVEPVGVEPVGNVAEFGASKASGASKVSGNTKASEGAKATEYRKTAEFALTDCEKIKCEHQVYSGIVTVFLKDGRKVCAARFSMRHIVRVAYAVRGAQTIIDAMEAGLPAAKAEKIRSREYEKYCGKCGRALPGTSKCPYCDGKGAVLRKFMALCGDFVGKLLLISLLMVLRSGVSLLTPMVQRDFIDNSLVTGQGTTADLWKFVGISFFLMAAEIGLAIYRYWNCAKLGATLSMSLRTKLYQKIQILSLSFINNRKPGELMNRVSRDTRRIRTFMEEVFGDMFGTLFTMIVSLVMMFIISWKMTLLSMVFIVLVFVITRMFWHTIHTIFHRQWLKEDDLSSSLQDVLSGMRIVKSFGKEERESAKFTKKATEYSVIQKKNETFWAVFFPILIFLMGVGTYVAIYFGGIHVLKGEMTVGQLVQFVAYSGYLFGPLGWMTHLPRAVVEMITSLNRIYDVLDEKPEMEDRADSKAFRIEGAFDFDHVSFGYQTYEPVLENINFQVKPGEMIGLVGASGTGKSTLINLIMRLYDVDQGKISIDGCDIKDIQMECLHSQIGVVLQETFLFSGSILANIQFAKRDATLEEVIRAAKAANAHDFICKTPDGYNTYVGEHGYNLSGGERQRISIARAILNNPRILILDEATSSLDTESEFLIQQALDRLIQGRTTFAIAHRLSTLKNADRLVVIDKHTIAEIGTHNELLEKKGIYYGLVNAQLQMGGNVEEKAGA